MAEPHTHNRSHFGGWCFCCGHVNGGNGGGSEFGHGGKGAAVSLDSSSINATSTGGNSLILSAEASGGNGGATDVDVAGNGGDATVSVSKTASVSSFTIQTTAFGGDGGGISYDGNVGFSATGNGGLASAATNVLNAERLGSRDRQRAWGERWRLGFRRTDGERWRGGCPTCQGITTGDYSVEVSSSAQGGTGRKRLTHCSDRAFNGGNGGDALATASGSNNGLNSVVVTSSAIGGAAYQGILGGTDGISGDATAMSTAFGLGAVTSTATATGDFLATPLHSAITLVLSAALRWRMRAQQARAEAPQRRRIPVEAFSLPSRLRLRRRSAVP